MDTNLQALEKELFFYRSQPLQKLFYGARRISKSQLLSVMSQYANTVIETEARTFWGKVMHVVLPEQVSTSIARYRFYEESLTKIFLASLKPGMVVYDVGAHFGYFSLLARHLVGTKGHVHAFEPTPSTFQILTKNLSNYSNVTLNNCGAWSKADELVLKDFGLKFAAYNSLSDPRISLATQNLQGIVEHKIPTVALDDYAKGAAARPDFIKIDAENAEYQILQGMTAILSHDRPLLSLEMGDSADNPQHSQTLVQYLIQRDYQPYELCNQTLVKHQLQSAYRYSNLLFIPCEAA